MTSGLTSFDIQEVRDVQSSKILGNVFDGLVGYAPGSTRLEPGLATGWTPSNGWATWTFRIRPNVVFSDGTPVTPSLVAAALSRIGNLADRSKISADDEAGEVTVRLDRADGDFPARVAQGYWGITLRKGKSVLGTGPYVVDPASTKTLVRLRRNPKYWGTPPKIDEVEFRGFGSGAGSFTKLREAIAAGEIDLTDSLPPWEADRLEGAPGVEVKRVASRSLTILGMNLRKKPLSDVRVRRAIAFAIDRPAAVRALFGEKAEVARAVIPPSILPTKPDPFVRDVPRAKALLAEAGFPNGFEITILDNFALGGAPPGVPLLSDVFAKDLAEIGIRLKRLPIRSFDEFLSRMAKGETELSISGWTADTGSAADWMESNFASAMTGDCPACNNAWFFSDPALDRHVEEARAKKSREALSGIVDIVYREVPIVPIVYGPVIFVHRRNLGGVFPSAAPTMLLRDAVFAVR